MVELKAWGGVKLRMKEHVNLLSKATIPRGYIRKYNMYNNKHVLYWDYDNSELPVEELKKSC